MSDPAGPHRFEDIDLGSTIRGFAQGIKVFARYELKRILGRGGMGVVWLAHDQELDLPVALKFLPEEIGRDAEAMASLKRETRRGLELTHPNIVKTYGFLKDDRAAAIAMEYVDGSTLSALKAGREEHPWFEVDEIADWVRAMCEAIEYAHTRAKVIHRDLKPINVMLSASGEIKITDFGVAQVLQDSYSRVSTTAGSNGGTLVYMSPQQALGEHASVADDVYSLGATLYDLLSGKQPFGGNPSTIYIQIRDKVPSTIARRREELGYEGQPIPEAWEKTIAACLDKDAEKRPRSAAAVWNSLRGAVDHRRTEPDTVLGFNEEESGGAEAENGGVPLTETVIEVETGQSEDRPGDEAPGKASRGPLVMLCAVVVLALVVSAGWWFAVEAPRRAQIMKQEEERVGAAEAVQMAQEKADAEQKQMFAEEEARMAEERADEVERQRRMTAQAEASRLAKEKLDAEKRQLDALINEGRAVELRVHALEKQLGKDASGDESWESSDLARTRQEKTRLEALETSLKAALERDTKAKEERSELAARILTSRTFSVPTKKETWPFVDRSYGNKKPWVDVTLTTGPTRITISPKGIQIDFKQAGDLSARSGHTFSLTGTTRERYTNHRIFNLSAEWLEAQMENPANNPAVKSYEIGMRIAKELGLDKRIRPTGWCVVGFDTYTTDLSVGPLAAKKETAKLDFGDKFALALNASIWPMLKGQLLLNTETNRFYAFGGGMEQWGHWVAIDDPGT